MAKTATVSPPRPADQTERADLEWITPGMAAVLYFGLALLYFLPALLPGRQVFGTDYLAGGYMFYQFIGERLAAGELPKWVPYVYGGMPLASNPGSTYHPVHFLADLLLPTSKVLTIVFLVHSGLAGLGMFLLSRELECRRWIALLAGLAFQFTGIIMSWVYAGHDGRIMVATVAPLFFYFLHRGIRTGGIGAFIGAAFTLGLALLSFQIQNSYYLLLAAAIWAVFALFQLQVTREPKRLARVVGLGLGAVAAGFLLAAVNFLPFMDYIPESPRGTEGRGYEFSTSYSMPEGEILSLAVPEHHGVSVYDPEAQQPLFPQYRGENGFKLHTEYVGALVVVLLALGAFHSRRDRYWWFFLGLTVFAFTVALGGNTPIYRLYYELLPGTKQFRAPSLIYFVIALALVAMAARTLETMARRREEGAASRRPAEPGAAGGDRTGWIVAGIVAVALVGAALAPAPEVPGGPAPAQGWTRFALFAAAIGAALWAWHGRRLGTGAAAALLLALTLVDLWVIDRRFFHTVEGPETMFAPDDVTSFLMSQPGEFRIWTFPYPQAWRSGSPNGGNFPMLYALDQAGGEHPNPLNRWVQYIGAGEQTFTDWHNFIAEAAVVNTPEGQAIGFRSQPGFLDAANIRYVVSTAPLSHPGFREAYRGSALVYENTQALPRAYLVPDVVEVPEEQTLAALRSQGWNPRQSAVVEAGSGVSVPAGPLQGEATLERYTPDRIVVRTRASRPALLVLADNYYEGWEARVGGSAAPVLRVNHTMRGVVVPQGETEVEFVYVPTDLHTGLTVSLVAAAGLLGALSLLALRRRNRAAA